MANDFIDALKSIHAQARRVPSVEEGILQSYRRIYETLTLTDDAELEERGTTYYVGSTNHLANPYFHQGLTGWTATPNNGTIEVVSNPPVHPPLGLQTIRMGKTPSAGEITLSQTVTASPGQRWSASALTYLAEDSGLGNLWVELRSLNSGGTQIGLSVTILPRILGQWLETTVTNYLLPALTASLKFQVRMGPGFDFTRYDHIGLCRLVRETAIVPHDELIIAGEWTVS